MKRTRKIMYYYITSTGSINYAIDNNSKKDKMRYDLGNYFSESEARVQYEIIHKKGFISWLKSLIKK